MIGFIIGNWKLLSGLVAGALLAGYIGVLKVDLAVQEATVARLNADLATALRGRDACTARIKNILEARESDATVDPDNLDDFDVPPEWLLPFTGTNRTAE